MLSVTIQLIDIKSVYMSPSIPLELSLVLVESSRFVRVTIYFSVRLHDVNPDRKCFCNKLCKRVTLFCKGKTNELSLAKIPPWQSIWSFKSFNSLSGYVLFYPFHASLLCRLSHSFYISPFISIEFYFVYFSLSFFFIFFSNFILFFCLVVFRCSFFLFYLSLPFSLIPTYFSPFLCPKDFAIIHLNSLSLFFYPFSLFSFIWRYL